MPIKKRNTDSVPDEAVSAVSPAPISSPVKEISPNERKPSKWLPVGFKKLETISNGEHVCQIMEITGFTSKRSGTYLIKLELRTSTGKEGTLFLAFLHEPRSRWITDRNSGHMSSIMGAAGLPVDPGVEPSWFELTNRLRGVWFRVKVASRQDGSPYLDELEPINATERMCLDGNSGMHHEEVEDPKQDMDDHLDDHAERTFDDLLD